MRKALAAVLGLALAMSPAMANDGCQLVQVASLHSNVAGSDHFFVPARLAGRAMNLMVDTGGAMSLIQAELADELKLYRRRHDHPYPFVDASGRRLNETVSVKDFQLGGLPFDEPVDFIVMPGRGADGVNRFGGTIGVNVMWRYDVEFDNASRKLNLFRPLRCAGMGAYWANEYAELTLMSFEGRPVAKVELEGEAVRAVIDTGSSRTFMSWSIARRVFGLSPTSPGVVRMGELTLPSGQKMQAHSYTLPALTISAFRFENVEVILIDDSLNGVTLGMSQLKQLRLYFAFQARKLYATTADARR